jgi:GNAT superfamily N-acetyltransferase
LPLREIDPKTEAAVLEEIVALRLRVWAAQVPFVLSRDDLLDPFDPVARHWVAFHNDRVVGAARLSIHDRLGDVPEADCLIGVYPDEPSAPIGFLSRLVVAPEQRRRGLGRQLDEIRIEAAVQAGCRSLLALVFDVSGAARVDQFVARGFTVRGRGQRDTHPHFSALPAPIVVERVIALR